MNKKLKGKLKWCDTAFEDKRFYHYYDREACKDINYTNKMDKECNNWDRKIEKYGYPKHYKKLDFGYDLSPLDFCVTKYQEEEIQEC